MFFIVFSSLHYFFILVIFVGIKINSPVFLFLNTWSNPLFDIFDALIFLLSVKAVEFISSVNPE